MKHKKYVMREAAIDPIDFRGKKTTTQMTEELFTNADVIILKISCT
jgi:hypothetical protein